MARLSAYVVKHCSITKYISIIESLLKVTRPVVKEISAPSTRDVEALPTRLLNLASTSIQMVAKFTIANVSLTIYESPVVPLKPLLLYGLSKIEASIERGHAANSPFGLTVSVEGMRLCSSCAAFPSDCTHHSDRILIFNRLLADVELAPRPEHALFEININMQIGGLLCMIAVLGFIVFTNILFFSDDSPEDPVNIQIAKSNSRQYTRNHCKST